MEVSAPTKDWHRVQTKAAWMARRNGSPPPSPPLLLLPPLPPPPPSPPSFQSLPHPPQSYRPPHIPPSCSKLLCTRWPTYLGVCPPRLGRRRWCSSICKG